MRFLLNATAAISALLALATVVAWVRSYWVYDFFGVQLGRHSPRIATSPGSVHLFVIISSPEDGAPTTDVWWHSDPAQDDLRRGAFGFVYESANIGTRRLRGFIVPCWFAVLITAALPGYRLARRIRRRHPPGHCPACGRATPERCPECGTTGSQ